MLSGPLMPAEGGAATSRSNLNILSKALHNAVAHSDLSAPPALGLAQALERLRRKPRFHAKDHDLVQPHASGIESGWRSAAVKMVFHLALDQPILIGEGGERARKSVRTRARRPFIFWDGRHGAANYRFLGSAW
jgi:hypothetical protein